MKLKLGIAALVVGGLSACGGGGGSLSKDLSNHFSSFSDRYDIMEDSVEAVCTARNDRTCFVNSFFDEGMNKAVIYFSYDNSGVRQEKVLQELVEYLMKNSDAKVIIEGHADRRGGGDYNIALGLKRAEAVSDYLVSKGFAKDRIVVTSQGYTMPASGISEAFYGEDVTDRLAAGYAKDRRVECIVSDADKEDSIWSGIINTYRSSDEGDDAE